MSGNVQRELGQEVVFELKAMFGVVCGLLTHFTVTRFARVLARHSVNNGVTSIVRVLETRILLWAVAKGMDCAGVATPLVRGSIVAERGPIVVWSVGGALRHCGRHAFGGPRAPKSLFEGATELRELERHGERLAATEMINHR